MAGHRMRISDHRQNRVDTRRPNGLFVGRLCPHYVVGQLCPHYVLFGHDDDVNSLTVPSRQRLRQFPKKNDATATRALLPHRRVKTIICLSVFVTIIRLSVFVTIICMSVFVTRFVRWSVFPAKVRAQRTGQMPYSAR